MDSQRRFRRDDLGAGFFAAVAAVITWLANIQAPLKALGLTALASRLGAVVVVVLLVFVARVAVRRQRLRGLLEITGAWPWAGPPLCEVPADTLGLEESVLARATSANEDVPYLERNNDAALQRLLEENKVVVIVGPAGSGKSTSAYHVASKIAANRRVIVPRRPAPGFDPLSEVLSMLSGPRIIRSGAWLWLDDLEEYLRQGPLNMALLRTWLAGHEDRRLITTIGSEYRSHTAAENSPAGKSATVLIRMAKVALGWDIEWTGEELGRAERQYPKAGDKCRELSRFFALGDFHLMRYEAAVDACPDAAAIMKAAVAWRRAGLSRTIPLGFLHESFSFYTVDKVVAGERNVRFEAGIAWATDRCEKPAGPVTRASDSEHVELADVLLEAATSRRFETPLGVWELMAACTAGTKDEVTVAKAALLAGASRVSYGILNGLLDNLAVSPEIQEAARQVYDDAFSRTAPSVDAPSLSAAAARSAEPPIERYIAPLAWIYERPALWGVLRIVSLFVSDVAGLWVALLVGYFLSRLPSSVSFETARRAADHRIPFVALLAVILFAGAGLYRESSRRRNTARVLAVLSQGGLALLALRVFLEAFEPHMLNRGGLGSYELIAWASGLSWVTVSTFRGLFNRGAVWAANRSRGHRGRCALIGSVDQVNVLAGTMREDDIATEVCGYFGAAPTNVAPALPWLGEATTIEELEVLVFEKDIDELVICDPLVSDAYAAEIAESTLFWGVRLRMVAPDRHFLVAVSRYSAGEGLPLEELRFPEFTGAQSAAKRAFDLVLAFALAPFWVSLYVMSVVAIRLTSRGSATQQQSRPGVGQTFAMKKFRVTHSSANGRALGPPTRVGKVIEKFGLDELPQIINVLKGDMSFVGPRPMSPEDFNRLPTWQQTRTLVRPGITGLWQIAGRRDTDVEAMVRLDLYYVQHWSIFLDVEIILKTAVATVRNRRSKLTLDRSLGHYYRDRRAPFAPGILDLLPMSPMSFDDVVRVARVYEAGLKDVLEWLVLLEKKAWLEIEHGAHQTPRFVLSRTARAHLASDPREGAIMT